MPVWLQHLETIVPAQHYSQEFACEKMQQWSGDEKEQRLIRALYKKSGIDKRHSVIDIFDDGSPQAFFATGSDGRLREPGTGERNQRFRKASKSLTVALARRAIANCPGISPRRITHVITASCTGFYNPGPDYFIVRDLGLDSATQRYNLGFMGCYAAFPALRMASQFVQADPAAVVLVLCFELCSLHLQLGAGEDSILGNALFADGAAAAIVSADEVNTGGSRLRLDHFHSALIPEGEESMAWSVGDRGFDISLSGYVPKIIGANIRQPVQQALAAAGLAQDDVAAWAVHPGGRSIVDQVRQSLALTPEQVAPSLEVLRNYGNMSSVTVLFVLQEILRRPAFTPRDRLCAMAFGPGLTVELALLEREGCAPVPSAVPGTLALS